MSRQLYFAMSSAGRRQADRDTPLALNLIDQRVNITSRNYVETAKTIEEIFDCIGEEVVDREVTRMIRRITVEAPYNPSVAAAILAYVKGVAAAPVGTSTNKIITVTVTGTGSYVLTLPAYDGQGAQPTTAIPHNATAEAFKFIIESLDNIGYGNTTVLLAGGVYTVEFVGKRSNAPLPNFTVDNTGMAGGAAVVAQTQAGTQRTHAISENPLYQNYYTSFVMGFEDEAGSDRQLVGAQITAFRVTLPEGGGALTMAWDIVARDLIPIAGYIIPACVVARPMRLADCRLTHGGTDYTASLIDGAYAFNNNTVTGNPAYTGRGVKPTRLERARRRTRTFTFRLLGGLTQALRLEAESNPEAGLRRATVLRMGTEGLNITETFPNNLLTIDGAGIDFQGETDDSINRFASNADKVGATAPSSSVAYVPQATAFLLV
jgi:hypothetical protein